MSLNARGKKIVRHHHHKKNAMAAAFVAAIASAGCARGDDRAVPPQLTFEVSEVEARLAEPVGQLPADAKLPDKLMGAAIACLPHQTWLRAEVSAVAQSGWRQAIGAADLEADRTLANYVGIVARIPLYSAAEIDREREREQGLRARIAEAAGSIVTARAKVDALRSRLAMFKALEARSRLRVREGVAPTDELVGYTRSVSETQNEILEATAAYERARLSLLAVCAPEKVGIVDSLLNAP